MNEIFEKIKNFSTKLNEALDILELNKDITEAEKLEEIVNRPDFWDNPETAQNTMRKLTDLKRHIESWEKIFSELKSLEELSHEVKENDSEIINEIKNNLEKLEDEFDQKEFELMFSGDFDKNNAILSIHSGTGGTDAQDWAEMLLRMYLRFCEKMGFLATIVSRSDGEEAGIKSATIEISGHWAFGYLKSERGVHRLVRLSPFNADHARQTSFALVELIPEIEENELKIDEKDLKIETMRAGGHGGQSVNTTDSAVRITHLPTGLSATSQNERSQLQNKQLALKVLKSRLLDLENKKHTEKLSNLKGDNVSAEWGNQIRSYVLHPYTLVKDHRTNCETANTSAVLDGEITPFIEAFLRKNIT